PHTGAGRWWPMTEAEWLACGDPDALISAAPIHDRRLRLFAVACCYRIWGVLPDDHCRAAVHGAERYADGHARVARPNRAHDAVQAAWRADADGRRERSNGPARQSRSGHAYEAVELVSSDTFFKVRIVMSGSAGAAGIARAWGHGRVAREDFWAERA